ncbi:MAG: Hpt domain-containing protein [Planctomycetes bacterium]|nr:Hpt domain-containing protein [Planctomycetota bacterium]
MPEENTKDRQVFSVENSLDLVAGDKELLQEVIEDYIKDLPAKLQELQNAISEGNLKQVELISHSIKGTGVTLGAAILSEAARKVEDACMAGRTAEIPALFKAIPPAFEEYNQAVVDFDWNSLP